MKKLIFGLLLILLPIKVHAQSQFIDADVTTTVHIFVVTAAGAATSSLTQAVTLQFDLTKPDGTNSTFFCTPSGGNNDCISEVNSIRVELTNLQLSNEGPNLLSWNAGAATCCQGGFASLMVLEAAGTDCWRDGNCATAASIDALIDTDTVLYATAADIPIYIYDTATNLGKTGLADIVCSITGITGGTVGSTATTTDTTEEEVDATLQKGEYTVRVTAAENTFDKVMMDCESPTAGTSVYKTYWYPQR